MYAIVLIIVSWVTECVDCVQDVEIKQKRL